MSKSRIVNANTIRYLANRLGQGLVVVFGAIAISFVLFNVLGRPADIIGGPFMTPEDRAALNARLGYDRPLLDRFFHYITGIFRGDFGVSYRSSRNAIADVLAVLPNTIILVLSAILLAGLIALPLAIFSVRHRETLRDRFLRRSVGFLQGMPEFWLSLMLVLAFSVSIPLLPSFGFTQLSALVLPTLALALPIIPTFFRLFRGQLLDVLGNDFVEAMKARGLSGRVIVYHHGLRNMVGPAATFAALQLGYLLGGSLVVETIFSWPGIGNLAVSSITLRDFAVTQTIIIVIAVFYVVLNLVADLVVLTSDPRIRVEST
ncbi:ABC transporter permease [Saccharomonospora sp. NPDC006951]